MHVGGEGALALLGLGERVVDRGVGSGRARDAVSMQAAQGRRANRSKLHYERRYTESYSRRALETRLVSTKRRGGGGKGGRREESGGR